MKIDDWRIKIFVDTANPGVIAEMAQCDFVKGVTTNPTILRKCGITDYAAFIKHITKEFPQLSFSFEVLANDTEGMRSQAFRIHELAPNAYVKIPIVDCEGRLNCKLIGDISEAGVNVNVTACFTYGQCQEAIWSVDKKSRSYISVFCGRINDTFVPVEGLMRNVANLISHLGTIELLWASAREPYNIVQAIECNADIITVFPEFVRKLDLVGKDLEEFSRETVQMFVKDAKEAGYTL